MCFGCYEDYGSPAIVSDTTKRAAALCERVYEQSCVGGRLHIVLDDWNLEDGSLQFCMGDIEKGEAGESEYGDPIDPETLAIERECCEALMAMTLEERASALAIQWGYISA